MLDTLSFFKLGIWQCFHWCCKLTWHSLEWAVGSKSRRQFTTHIFLRTGSLGNLNSCLPMLLELEQFGAEQPPMIIIARSSNQTHSKAQVSQTVSRCSVWKFNQLMRCKDKTKPRTHQMLENKTEPTRFSLNDRYDFTEFVWAKMAHAVSSGRSYDVFMCALWLAWWKKNINNNTKIIKTYRKFQHGLYAFI